MQNYINTNPSNTPKIVGQSIIADDPLNTAKATPDIPAPTAPTPVTPVGVIDAESIRHLATALKPIIGNTMGLPESRLSGGGVVVGGGGAAEEAAPEETAPTSKVLTIHVKNILLATAICAGVLYLVARKSK